MDITTQWVWLQRNKQHLGTLIVALTAFGAGWQFGQVSSPYYASNPIVFNDKECPSALSSGGSREELEQLNEEGLAARQEETKKTEESAAPASANIAGAVTEITPSVATAAKPTADKKFVGSVNSRLFHDPSCAASKRIKEANQIWFTSMEEAQKAGYEPSQCTKEKLGM